MNAPAAASAPHRRRWATLLRRAAQLAALTLFLWLFFVAAWPYAAASGAIRLSEPLPLEFFLWLDPLSGITAAIAARQWTVSLIGAGAILAACIIVPRLFCGYVCPLGTLIDAFDLIIRRPLRKLRLKRINRLAHTRYYVLAALLVSAAMGALISGFFSPIPLLTRGLMLTAARLELGWRRNWGMLTPLGIWAYVSIALFAAVFILGILAPRFWCRYVCPAGAMFSLAGFLRVFERRINRSCNHCDRCRRACPFDAISPDHATRPLDCAFCRTCASVCPGGAIEYAWRFRQREAAASDKSDMIQPSRAGPSRRLVLASAIGGAASALAVRASGRSAARPIRPPGSVGENRFSDLCVRCDGCLKVCPGAMLKPAGLEAGFDNLWTPVVDFVHAGCHPDCNFCTQVCPTRAIQPLSIQQKRRWRMGLARIDDNLCLSHRRDTECDPELSLRHGQTTTPCIQECRAAGYNAIAIQRVKINIGDVPEGMASPEELESWSHLNVPVVDAEACVGCGLCEYICHAVMVKQRQLLPRRAVTVSPLA